MPSSVKRRVDPATPTEISPSDSMKRCGNGPNSTAPPDGAATSQQSTAHNVSVRALTEQTSTSSAAPYVSPLDHLRILRAWQTEGQQVVSAVERLQVFSKTNDVN